MARVKDILQWVEGIAPPELAEDWDNVGLLVNSGGEVNRVLVALDITHDVVAEAAQAGCRLILAHHPVIFRPLRRIDSGDVVAALLQNGISAICAHTNLDAAEGGVNDVLAARMGLTGTAPFAGFGRVGFLPAPLGAAALAAQCAGALGTRVRYVDGGKPIRSLAVLGGSGGSLVGEAQESGIDAVLTGEAGHHDALDAADAGISLFVAGHYHTEFPVVPVLAERLREAFTGITVLESRRNVDPFQYLP